MCCAERTSEAIFNLHTGVDGCCYVRFYLSFASPCFGFIPISPFRSWNLNLKFASRGWAALRCVHRKMGDVVFKLLFASGMSVLYRSPLISPLIFIFLLTLLVPIVFSTLFSLFYLAPALFPLVVFPCVLLVI